MLHFMIILDHFWNENMQEGHFWKFIFGSFDLRGVFWELQKNLCFLEKAISRKIVASFQSFKQAQDHPKPTLFVPPNILNKLLSKNPTLTKRCEVNKFNQVTYFSFQESSISHLFMGRFNLKFLQRNNSYLT